MTLQEFNTRFTYNPATDSLGGGGFGKIFKAWDNDNDCYVALKIQNVDPQFPEVRLSKEVTMAAALKHPNIAHYKECHTFSTLTGEVDIAIMSYYESGSLDKLMASRQLSYDNKVDILTQILHGIAYLHDHGVIHRDLKPQNILILYIDGRYIPKITDFGISKQLKEGDKSSVVNSTKFVSRLYASPEQLLGENIKKNTDLWSFGVIAYQMFVGKTPFNTAGHTFDSELGRAEFFRQVTSGMLPQEIETIPGAWQHVVRRCMTISNNLRYSQASEVLNDLPAAVNSGNSSGSISNNMDEATILEHNKQKPKRGKKLWLWIVLVVLLVGGGIALILSINSDKKEEPVKTDELTDEEYLEEFINAISQAEAQDIEIGVVESSRIEPLSFDSYSCYARAGETLTVVVVGDGNTDLDLFIFDRYNEPIMADTEDEDVCVCELKVETSGYYIFAIVNWDEDYNSYEFLIEYDSSRIEESDRVDANEVNSHEYYAEAGEEVSVHLKGDGDTDLDLFILDEEENVITADNDDTGDSCSCVWTAKESGIYTIAIKNYGDVYNEYTITIE